MLLCMGSTCPAVTGRNSAHWKKPRLCQEGFYPIVFLPDFLADTDTSILEILCRCVDIAPLRNPNRNSYRIAYQVPPGDERVGLPQQDFFLAGGMKLMLKLEFLPHYITLRGKPPAGPPPARAGSHLSSKLARPSPWPHARFRVGLALFSLSQGLSIVKHYCWNVL